MPQRPQQGQTDHKNEDGRSQSPGAHHRRSFPITPPLFDRCEHETCFNSAASVDADSIDFQVLHEILNNAIAQARMPRVVPWRILTDFFDAVASQHLDDILAGVLEHRLNPRLIYLEVILKPKQPVLETKSLILAGSG